jgi:hypothetical protein
MGDSSEIRAGGAHVEIGGESKTFDEAADRVTARNAKLIEGFRNTGGELVSLGAKISAVAAAFTAPMAAGAHAIAEYGASIAKFQGKTRLSSDMIAGLKEIADETGAPMGGIVKAVVTMNRNLDNESKKSRAALQAIGLSFGALKPLNADDKFRGIIDALSKVSDEGTRAALAQKIFGGAAMALIPIIEEGAAALDEAKRNAKILGSSLNDEANAGALELYKSMKRLKGGIEGIALAIGNAVMPVLKPLIDRFVDAVVYTKNWINANPALIQQLEKIALGIGYAGAALVNVGLAIKALTSPTLFWVGSILMVGAAILALTDTFGVTDTGFRTLFNSIKINGMGATDHLANCFLVTVQSPSGCR